MTNNFTEQALRSAVNTTKSDTSASSNQVADLKTAAVKRVRELLSGNSTLSSLGSELNLQTVAINAAIQGLELSYLAIKGQIEHLNDKRLAFDKERLAGIATFIVPTNREENELSTQEQVLKAFMDLIKTNPSFAPYLGIQSNYSDVPHGALFYSVLPYYKMSDALVHPISSTKAIDKQRTAINLFFKSALPDAIADIDNDFQTESKFIEFWKSAYNKDNYLNDLRAPRFLMMCLANLLWNLQHPVDPETGYPLSIERNIDLCREVSLFLNKLLNSAEKSSLKELNDYQNNLLTFVRKVELHVKTLRKAFIEEHLYELNIDDLTNSAHHTLRIMDKSIYELLYHRINPGTNKKQPDPKAAEKLAYKISYLNQLLTDAPELIKPFASLTHNAKDTPFLNQQPHTVLDVLILFLHSTSEEKDNLLTTLTNNTSDAALEFAETLKSLNLKFIVPIKDMTKKELEVSVFHKKKTEVAQLVAKRLIPLITLVLEDYRVDVDSPAIQSATHGKKYSAYEQVTEINKMANQGKGYYVWALSPFITLNAETETELDQLPKHQYRFTEITKLLDSVTEILQNYRTFLQYPAFQQFLIKCLGKIKEEYAELSRHINRVDGFLSKDKSISRSMQTTLGSMTTNLSSGLEDYSKAFSIFEQIISAPNFTAQQKLSLSTKIGSIHERYVSLFNEDSGILSFVTPLPPLIEQENNEALSPAPAVSPTSSCIQPKQLIVLRSLITRCLDSLSLQSNYGEKGKLLTNLLALIDSKGNLTPENMEQAVYELAKITLSYRPSSLFQAAYGATQSAKELIACIKDPEVNNIIPIADLLLGKDRVPGVKSDAELIARLSKMRLSKQWEESSSEIKAMVALG